MIDIKSGLEFTKQQIQANNNIITILKCQNAQLRQFNTKYKNLIKTMKKEGTWM